MLKSFNEFIPKVDESVWIAENASVIGDVEIGTDSSVWYNAVLRGDVGKITIGNRTNIQDGTIIHCSGGRTPTIIGDDNVIGHRAILHGCTIGNKCLIGMGAIILDGVVVPDHTVIAAGALVTENKHLEGGYMYVGIPAKKVKPVSPEAIQHIQQGAKHYVENAHQHAKGEVLSSVRINPE